MNGPILAAIAAVAVILMVGAAGVRFNHERGRPQNQVGGDGAGGR